MFNLKQDRFKVVFSPIQQEYKFPLNVNFLQLFDQIIAILYLNLMFLDRLLLGNRILGLKDSQLYLKMLIRKL